MSIQRELDANGKVLEYRVTAVSGSPCIVTTLLVLHLLLMLLSEHVDTDLHIRVSCREEMQEEGRGLTMLSACALPTKPFKLPGAVSVTAASEQKCAMRCDAVTCDAIQYIPGLLCAILIHNSHVHTCKVAVERGGGGERADRHHGARGGRNLHEFRVHRP
jgi:hypothetical protein